MKKKIIIALVVLAVLAVSVFAGIKLTDADNEGEATESISAQSVNGSEIEVSEIFSYTGNFVEDGSDSEVRDICAVRIKNTTSSDKQLVRFCITTEKGEKLYFEATTLFAFKEMTVLEKNAAAYEDDMKTADVEFTAVADFTEAPSVYPEIFSLTAVDSVINVENISANDVDGTVFLYYKTIDDDGFFGGITYRVRVEDGIKAGELKQLSLAHFNAETSKVVFITYGE